jgi:hypothetical protein
LVDVVFTSHSEEEVVVLVVVGANVLVDVEPEVVVGVPETVVLVSEGAGVEVV